MRRKSPQRRMFIALDLPEEVRVAVAALPTLFSEVPGLSWTDPRQLHLTLRFLGEVDEYTGAVIVEGLRRVPFAPFRLVTTNLGFFPNEQEPEIFWLGVNHDDRLPAFKGQLDQLLAANGFPRENRRFAPHATLARIHQPLVPEVMLRLHDARIKLVGHGWAVTSFSLYASEVTPAGTTYAVAETYLATPGLGKLD